MVASTMKHYNVRLCLLLLTLAMTTPTLADDSKTINALTITKSTVQAMPSCLHYRVVGLCFWLYCGIGCSFNTSKKVEHFIPDFVTTVYPKYKHDPWFEVNKTLDIPDHYVGNKLYQMLNSGMTIEGGENDSAGSSNSDVKLKEVDVLGNPALSTMTSSLFLKGQASSYVPYYQSQLDADSWRSGLLEQIFIKSLIPGKDDVGTFLLNEWGSVYPRSGFVMQPNNGKSSAVIAVRGASIATSNSFDHLGKHLPACPEHDCTTAGEVETKSPQVEWQMVYPDNETECHQDINSSSNPDWTKHQADDQAYAWVVWRHYKGCLPGEGAFLGSVG